MRCGIPDGQRDSADRSSQTLEPASNNKERAHLFELLGQRITGYMSSRVTSRLDNACSGRMGRDRGAHQGTREHFGSGRLSADSSQTTITAS
jgi:hypothetical protein